MKIAAALLIAVLLFAGQAAPRAQAQTCGETYTVRLGETLYSIAERCGLTYVELIGINFEISDPSKIYPGQVIRLVAEAPIDQYRKPASGPAQDAGLQPGGAYIVRKGDSLMRIAYLYGTTITELVRYNPVLLENAIIVPGQVLIMPPEARDGKGWVGVSRLAVEGGDEIEVRAADFTPYSMLEMRLVIEDEEDTSYFTIQVKTDARGDARGTLVIPWYAWEDEIYVVYVYNMDEPEFSPVKSPGIRVID